MSLFFFFFFLKNCEAALLEYDFYHEITEGLTTTEGRSFLYILRDSCCLEEILLIFLANLISPFVFIVSLLSAVAEGPFCLHFSSD